MNPKRMRPRSRRGRVGSRLFRIGQLAHHRPRHRLDRLIEHGTQRHRVHRFVQQVETFDFRLMQRCRIGIAADEKSRNWRRQFAAQPFDGFDAGPAIGQVIIRDDQVRQIVLLGRRLECLTVAVRGDNPATPFAENPAHALKHQRIVVDHQDELVMRQARLGARNDGRLDGPLVGRSERDGDGKDGALAHGRLDRDRVTEKTAEAIDDGKPEAETGAPVAIRLAQPIELAEYLVVLIGRNADAGVPHLDAQLIAALAAADQHAAAARIAQRVLNQVENDLLQQNEVAPTQASLGNARNESFFSRAAPAKVVSA